MAISSTTPQESMAKEDGSGDQEAHPDPLSAPAETPVKKKKKSRKKWWFLLLFLVIGGAIAGGVIQKGREKPLTVETVLLERIPVLKSEVSASGTIEAKNSVDIQAEIAGNIIELPVVEGQWVEKDEILVKIDPAQTLADLKATAAQYSAAEADARAQEVQVAQAKANLARDVAFRTASEAELEQATLRHELATKRYERVKSLYDGGINSDDELDAAYSEERLAKASIRLANARIAQYDAQIEATKLTANQVEESWESLKQRAEAAKANLERWEDLLERTTIRSPLRGLITQLNVDEGERAVPGVLSNPQATLMTIADMSALEAWIEVDESDIVKVKKTNVVRVDVDAVPDRTIQAQVSEIGYAPVVSAAGTQEGKDFLVKATLLDLPEDLASSLRPGMSCDASITTAVVEDILVMPIQAWRPCEVAVDEEGNYLPEQTIWPSKQNKDDKKQSAQTRFQGVREEIDGVFIIQGDRVKFRPIEIGISGEMDLQVIAGLEAGEEIVVGPYKTLRELIDNSWIKIDNSESFYFNRGKSSE